MYLLILIQFLYFSAWHSILWPYPNATASHILPADYKHSHPHNAFCRLCTNRFIKNSGLLYLWKTFYKIWPVSITSVFSIVPSQLKLCSFTPWSIHAHPHLRTAKHLSQLFSAFKECILYIGYLYLYVNEFTQKATQRDPLFKSSSVSPPPPPSSSFTLSLLTTEVLIW